MTPDDDQEWADFCQRLLSEELIATIARRSGEPSDRVKAVITAHVAEAAVGIDVARRGLAPGQRVLEVGAGLGIVSLYLRRAGYDITALEPFAEGFELLQIASAEIAARSGMELPRIDRSVETLSLERDGKFDFIFSVNVLEHVPNFHRALDAMARVLQPGGSMIHSCPNYWVPYEPHLSIPLVPLAPAVTAAILPARVRQSAVWRSLNFVTYGDAKRAARRNDLVLSFVPGLMSKMFRRLTDDPVFAERHGGPIRWTGMFLAKSGLLRLLDALPAALATPMIFVLRSPLPAPSGASSGNKRGRI